MNKKRTISYLFKFIDDSQLEFDIHLNEEGILIPKNENKNHKEGTRLEHHKCTNCPLTDTSHCPVAINLDEVVEKTKDKISHERASVIVKSPERNYHKDTDT